MKLNGVNMNIELKDYQREAVKELKEYFNLYLKKKGKNIVFKAPTGSGKTVIVSTFVEEIVKENSDNLTFIWVSIGKGDLHKQSFRNVKKYLNGFPKCVLIEDDFFGSRNILKKNEIIFINWEKLVQKDKVNDSWKNNLMKDQEGTSFVDALNNTRDSSVKIILIIDESHIGKNQTTRIQEFKSKIINPDVTIEISATPFDNPDINVETQRVIDEGMIKQNIIVNEGINSELDLYNMNSEEIILDFGYKKLIEIDKNYTINNIKVKPLMLIQIPNKEAGQDKIDKVKDFLKKNNINIDRELRIWLSETSKDIDFIDLSKNSSSVRFLIFKTAIATGWDCPRAHILVKFRESNSETFEIQTIGRILRTAEAKTYKNTILDNAYMFTNLSNFTVDNLSYDAQYLKIDYSELIDNKSINDYSKLDIKSYYKSRSNNYNAIDSRFYDFFEEEFCNFFNISISSLSYDSYQKMIDKGFNDSLDAIGRILKETNLDSKEISNPDLILSNNIGINLSNNDVSSLYYEFIRNNLNGFAFIRSKSPVNGSIMETLKKYYGIIEEHNRVEITQKLVLNNLKIFEKILSNATMSFKDFLSKLDKKNILEYNFNITNKRYYSIDNYINVEGKLSLHQPFKMLIYDKKSKNVNQLERSFVNILDSLEDKVMWYWQNGSENLETNFGIYCNETNTIFRPDFIIKLKNNNILIVDTKSVSDRIDDTRNKSECLQNYIINANKNRPSKKGEIFGGIVVSQDYKNFFLNKEIRYHTLIEKKSEWIDFSEFLKQISS
jgi:type III restriction enzyme